MQCVIKQNNLEAVQLAAVLCKNMENLVIYISLLIGKVLAIFMNPKIEFSFSKDASSEKIHITRAHLIVTEKTKLIPTYDSNIPLVCFIYSFL